jgi:hypothetical protein
MKKASCLLVWFWLGVLLLGLFEFVPAEIKEVFASSSPISAAAGYDAMKLLMNASAFMEWQRNAKTKDGTQYWSYSSYLDPYQLSRSDGLESEAVAHLLLTSALIYNTTKADVWKHIAKETRDYIENVLIDNSNYQTKGGMWLAFNNETKAYTTKQNSGHNAMALMGLSIMYGATNDIAYKTTADKIRDWLENFSWNETNKCYRTEWDNSTQSWSATTNPANQFWQAAGLSYWLQYVGSNSTTASRIQYVYDWNYANNSVYQTFKVFFDNEHEMFMYHGFGHEAMYLRTGNTTYLETFHNVTHYNIALMSNNPKGNNGSLPHTFSTTQWATWDTTKGMKGWSQTMAFRHMARSYGLKANSTVKTYMNKLFKWILQNWQDEGYIHFGINTNDYNQDNRTWASASPMMITGLLDYYDKVETPSYPYPVYSSISAKGYGYSSDLKLFYIKVKDVFAKGIVNTGSIGGWGRQQTSLHRISLKSSLAPQRIYVNETLLNSANYSYNSNTKILDINFTSPFNTETNLLIYLEGADFNMPYITSTNGTVYDAVFVKATNKLTIKTNGTTRYVWSLGSTIFSDDFSSYAQYSDGTPTWVAKVGTPWNVTDGKFRRSYQSSWEYTVLNSTYDGYSNFRITFDFDIYTDTGWILNFIYNYANISANDYGYYVQMYDRGGYQGIGFGQYHNDYNSALLRTTQEGTNFVVGTLYQFRIEKKGLLHQIYMNDTLKFEWIDNSYPRTGGTLICLNTLRAYAEIDNIEVKEYVQQAAAHDATIKVYTGTKGKPNTVKGASSWSYNATTKILTVTVKYSSPVTITIDWTTTTTSSSSTSQLTYDQLVYQLTYIVILLGTILAILKLITKAFT